MKKLILLLLLLSLCLSGWGHESAAPSYAFDDLSIQIPEDYINLSDEEFAEGLSFIFGHDPIAGNGLRDEKAVFAAYGLELDLQTYGNLLAAKARYSSVPSAKFTLTVDGKTISGSADMAQPIDILRYLDADENGIPLVGEHWVRFTPSATASDTFRVNTTVILKTIEKQ